MNRTQELITDSFSLGHAVGTIDGLRKTALSQIDLYEKEVPGSETIIKLKRAYLVLDSLLERAKDANDILNGLDDAKIGSEKDRLYNEWLKGEDANRVMDIMFDTARKKHG